MLAAWVGLHDGGGGGRREGTGGRGAPKLNLAPCLSF